ncbi:hypothetical protein [Arcobacter arenosus]|jgi:hypothetical protein|uniref:Uncharacterized protein n=1 Tax=Arcobacter arenosus TaxID=2576037 RepID=A0A5R8XZ07_9BACT|nr:hypothetical protein [Arcobacter arenosus]TLP36247.1 hypothetical protein FDK22_13340 [Arcobacter arenosus]
MPYVKLLKELNISCFSFDEKEKTIKRISPEKRSYKSTSENIKLIRKLKEKNMKFKETKEGNIKIEEL